MIIKLRIKAHYTDYKTFAYLIAVSTHLLTVVAYQCVLGIFLQLHSSSLWHNRWDTRSDRKYLDTT